MMLNFCGHWPSMVYGSKCYIRNLNLANKEKKAASMFTQNVDKKAFKCERGMVYSFPGERGMVYSLN